MSREKQIEEMARVMCYRDDLNCKECPAYICKARLHAAKAYNAGYRKQSEGEWIKDNTSKFEHRYNCSVCDFRQVGKPTPYCPNCGARMKGGE